MKDNKAYVAVKTAGDLENEGDIIRLVDASNG